jgi:hypothetical protein
MCFIFFQTGPLAITAGPGRTPLSPVNKGGYRPRATTESGQRPSRPMRQTTLDESGRHNKTDLGSSVDSGNEVFAGSVENEPEPSREKGLPTIFKYQGQGKEVYVCGKNTPSDQGFLTFFCSLDHRSNFISRLTAF